MAKKELKRRKKNKKPKKLSIRTVDHHHLCWTRRSWNSGPLKDLRLHWYCIVLLPKNTLHRHIHLNMPGIPPPRWRSAKSALEQLGYLEKYDAISEFDSIEKRLRILAALFDCSDQPTADGFRKQLEIVQEFKKSSP